MWIYITSYYALAGLITFCLYGWDKRAAIKSNWRISEKKLLLWGLAGGWIGALIAMRIFKHKRQKGKYLIWFWLAVIVNLGGLGAIVCLFGTNTAVTS